MEEYLQFGVITTTHGVRGEVKVYPTTDPERFLSLDRVFLDTGKEKKELHVTGVRFFKQLAIVKFKGIAPEENEYTISFITNIKDKVNQTVGDIAFRSLKN